MPAYTSTDPVPYGFPLGALGAGKFEVRSNGSFDAFTLMNNWSEPLVHKTDYPGVLGFHLGCTVEEPGGTLRRGCLLQTAQFPGVAGVSQIDTEGIFPYIRLRYLEPSLGLEITLRAQSPWVPGDDRCSALPGVLFSLEVKNTTPRAVSAGLIFIARNICGSWCVGRRNRIRNDRKYVRLDLSNEDQSGIDSKAGSMCLAFENQGWRTSYWAGWNAVVENFKFDSRHCDLRGWHVFLKEGVLPNEDQFPVATGENRELLGAVAAKTPLSAGETKVWHFTMAWDFPNNPFGHRMSNFKDASAVSHRLVSQRRHIERASRRWKDAIFSLPFPEWFNDALCSTLTPFVASSWYLRDGQFAFYEAPEICPLMSTLDVGFYGSLPLAYFFPTLERTQIEAFARAQRPDGYVPHDLGRNRIDRASDGTTFYRWKDLNSKFVLMVYRDYLWGGGLGFLKKLFPSVLRAMAWMLHVADADSDGLPDHEGSDSTFDLWSFKGPIAYTSGLFLAALLATERMARLLDRRPIAEAFCKQFEVSRSSFDQKLWNGKYFGDACLTCQLNGQWYADLLGLGRITDDKKIRSTVESVLSLNGRVSRFGLVNSVRRNGRPDHSNPHAGNIWPGMNYAFLSLCILQDISMTNVLKELQKMWDNMAFRQKNPWNQADMIDSKNGRNLFGDFYYRNMAIWAIPLAFAKKDKRCAEIMRSIAGFKMRPGE